MAPQQRKASVIDVARHAGVSVGTVSNVLNRPGVVSESTRQRVEQAIAELSFVRNGTARRLRAGMTTTIAAIVLDIRNPFFTEVARGIEDRLAEDELTLMLASSDDDPEREARCLRMFEEHGIRGLIVTPGRAGTDQVEVLHRRGVPTVLLDAPPSESGIASVTVDNEAGGALAARHLLDRGHQKITVLGGHHGIWQCRERLAGVRRAVADAGLDPDEAIVEIVLDALDAASGDAALRALAEQQGGPPEAVFCINDLIAIGVQRAVRRLGGGRLLAQTDIVGYDDLDISAELAVPLTSVRQPAAEMGRTAAELLLDEETGPKPDRVVFRPELIVRASSGGDAG